MSESAGSATATFTTPSSPTTGLQNYDLEGSKKNLTAVPSVATNLRQRLRAMAAKHRGAGNATVRSLRKDSPLMRDTIDAMVDALSKSVSAIVAAQPADATELLAKSFGEFKAAAASELDTLLADSVQDALAKRAPDEPLFKGLGCVGRVAGLLQTMANQVANIKSGKDYSGQDDSRNNDPASDLVGELLDHSVSCAELALRAAVNEHVDIADDDDNGDAMPEGMHLILVPNADAPDVEKAAVRCKTDLPEGLYKYAVDPAYLAEMAAEAGASVLITAGVPQKALAKLFDGGDLTKAAPDADPSMGDAGAAGADDMADPATDDGADDGTDDDMDPLTIAGRLAAALLIQINHIQEMVSGDGMEDPTAPPDTASSEATTPPAPMARSAVPMSKRAPVAPAAELRAMQQRIEELERERAALEKGTQDLLGKMAPLLGMPRPAKGVIMAPAVDKGRDTGGEAAETEAARKEALAKMDPESRTREEIKAAFRRPIRG